MEGTYILHFDEPVSYYRANQYGDERHYVGSSIDVMNRFEQHLAGEGSLFTKSAKQQTIDMHLAAVYPVGLVAVEQHLTRVGASKLCPICIIEATPKLSIAARKKRRGESVYRVNKEVSCCQCLHKIGQGALVQGVVSGGVRRVRHYSHFLNEEKDNKD